MVFSFVTAVFTLFYEWLDATLEERVQELLLRQRLLSEKYFPDRSDDTV